MEWRSKMLTYFWDWADHPVSSAWRNNENDSLSLARICLFFFLLISAESNNFSTLYKIMPVFVFSLDTARASSLQMWVWEYHEWLIHRVAGLVEENQNPSSDQHLVLRYNCQSFRSLRLNCAEDRMRYYLLDMLNRFYSIALAFKLLRRWLFRK